MSANSNIAGNVEADASVGAVATSACATVPVYFSGTTLSREGLLTGALPLLVVLLTHNFFLWRF